MAPNFPGPYEYRLIYQTVSNGVPTISQMRLSVNVVGVPAPGEDYTAIVLEGRDTTTQTLAAWEADLLTYLRPIFHTLTDFVASELWLYVPGTYDATFVTGATISVLGTNGSASTQDGQAIISFRSTTGGRAKLVLMQPSLVVGATQTFPTAVAIVNDLAGFLRGTATPAIARDGGHLLIQYKYNMGLSETLFKRRLRF